MTSRSSWLTVQLAGLHANDVGGHFFVDWLADPLCQPEEHDLIPSWIAVMDMHRDPAGLGRVVTELAADPRLLAWRRSARVRDVHLEIGVQVQPPSDQSPSITVYESGRDIYGQLHYPTSVYVSFCSDRRTAAIVVEALAQTIHALPESRRPQALDLGSQGMPRRPVDGSSARVQLSLLAPRQVPDPALTALVMDLAEELDAWGAGVATAVSAEGSDVLIVCQGPDSSSIEGAVYAVLSERGLLPQVSARVYSDDDPDGRRVELTPALRPDPGDSRRWPMVGTPTEVPPETGPPITVEVWVPRERLRGPRQDRPAIDLINAALDEALTDVGAGSTDEPEIEEHRIGFFLLGDDPDALIAASPVLASEGLLPASASITDDRDRTGSVSVRNLA